MSPPPDYVQRLLGQLQQMRRAAGFTAQQAESELLLGPGWVTAIETGSIIPSLDLIAAMVELYGESLATLATAANGTVGPIRRALTAYDDAHGLMLDFPYGEYDATYHLPGASREQFESVVRTLRDQLALLSSLKAHDSQQAQTIKTESVAASFLHATNQWPNANPSDLWWFVIYRAYCDQYNHPSENSRLDFTQSWKRTGGWALERILVRHYAAEFAKNGINLYIADAERIKRLLKNVTVAHRLEADKIDVVLTVGNGESERLIGVIHVKASFAERRTDDVPMSQALVHGGYISPLWTMDCKSVPARKPHNKGELGQFFDGSGTDRRGAKRKDIEDDRYFSACFSYNLNTNPTPSSYAANARVFVCDFSNPNDAFLNFIIAERDRVKKDLGI